MSKSRAIVLPLMPSRVVLAPLFGGAVVWTLSSVSPVLGLVAVLLVTGGYLLLLPEIKGWMRGIGRRIQ